MSELTKVSLSLEYRSKEAETRGDSNSLPPTTPSTIPPPSAAVTVVPVVVVPVVPGVVLGAVVGGVTLGTRFY